MKTHGMRWHPLYKTWCEMRYRCEKPWHHVYKFYGGRGIKVCDRWQHFPHFVADMGEKPEGKTVDRIDVNGDYEPANCRWASKETQMNNMRSNRIIEFDGRAQTMTQWSKELGIKVATIWARFKYGYTVEEALTATLYKRPQANARAQGGIR